ncbi:hypothetical protein J6590_069771 [Homalodisca vitripennis]|nr:hypothetical protein J6590_069771 [Homalodisca vitripennis]
MSANVTQCRKELLNSGSDGAMSAELQSQPRVSGNNDTVVTTSTGRRQIECDRRRGEKSVIIVGGAVCRARTVMLLGASYRTGLQNGNVDVRGSGSLWPHHPCLDVLKSGSR